jgi:hypothetical protein
MLALLVLLVLLIQSVMLLMLDMLVCVRLVSKEMFVEFVKVELKMALAI